MVTKSSKYGVHMALVYLCNIFEAYEEIAYCWHIVDLDPGG